MKRFILLLILLLIMSALNCSKDESAIGPASPDDVRSENNSVEAQKITDPAVFESGTSDDDGDPWEDNGPDGDGDKGPEDHEPVHDPGGDGDKDSIYPHDPDPGDEG